MLVVNGLIAGTMPTQGLGGPSSWVEFINVDFSVGSYGIEFSLSYPSGLTDTNEDLIATITMKYPEA